MSGDRLRAPAAVAMVTGLAVACGGPTGTGSATAGATDTEAGSTATPTRSVAEASPTPSPDPRFDGETRLPDGRRVGMSYVAGRGLVERHRDADTGAWSVPRLVYATATDRCHSLTLQAFGDTVAVIADWGVYCYDGEPPTESIAAVGTAGLGRWDTKLTRDFDGWTKVAAQGEGDTRRLRFTRNSTETLTRLDWHGTGGFAQVEEIPR
ncbi:hypothetical protein QFZ66_007620 [Streptomyces sp. B4I13]|uniref:hypothetical protein n=1 Tax=Streptomyces sp. B4I13 TaxID=3042271 RepID=UPI0027840AF9|nr:hypothetical protein [Streptomyces sp. B4I13]MDQ0963742.1 hypothetical protein [Streptomyces sp. B4I13]